MTSPIEVAIRQGFEIAKEWADITEHDGWHRIDPRVDWDVADRKLEEHVANLAPAPELATVYTERTRLIALVATLCKCLGYRSGLGEHDPADAAWDPRWRTIVFIEVPTADGSWFQASWHVSDADRKYVAHLPPYHMRWDGHTTDEKYAAIDAVCRPPGGP